MTAAENARWAKQHRDAHALDDKADPLLAGLRTGTWLDQQVFPPLRWVVPGLIPEGATLLCGAPKVGKSWLALALALGCASGGTALGRIPVEQRPVFMLALEDSDRRMQDRARQLLERDPIPGALHYMTSTDPGQALATAAAWLERRRDAAPLIILDTLGKATMGQGSAESAYSREYKIGAQWKALADSAPGSGLLALHHTRKAASEDFVEASSGTNGLSGAFDAIAVLGRKRQDDGGVLSITGRDVGEGEYGLRLNGVGQWALDGADLPEAARAAAQARAESGLGDRSLVVLAALSEVATPVAAVVERTGLARKQVDLVLERLVKTGRVVRVARGMYATEGSEGVRETREVRETSRTTKNSGGKEGNRSLTSLTSLGGEGTLACERCGTSDTPLIAGRCRPCAYPAGGSPDEDDAA